jgi:hypothetical protein
MLLRGRCKACSTKISVQYPLVELLVAVLFARPAVAQTLPQEPAAIFRVGIEAFEAGNFRIALEAFERNFLHGLASFLSVQAGHHCDGA